MPSRCGLEPLPGSSARPIGFAKSLPFSGVIAQVTPPVDPRMLRHNRCLHNARLEERRLLRIHRRQHNHSLRRGHPPLAQKRNDDTAYRYIKYQAMVEYLIEKEQITVDELFTISFDEKELAEKTSADLE
jgi:hypothetical protein